jgi:hypothetical protein
LDAGGPNGQNGVIENKRTDGYFYKLMSCHSKLLEKIFKANNFTETHKERWSVCWGTGSLKPEVFHNLSFWQKVNHFPRLNELTRKDSMIRNLSKMSKKFGNQFNFVPKTYIMPQETLLLTRDHEKYRLTGKMYIVKPIGSSQGKGIYLTDSISEIMNRSLNPTVVSHYIEDPLLINGYKFDLRIYVTITSVDPLRIYIYEEGIARFATEPYTLNGDLLDNKYIHLTNFSINKHSENFFIDKEKENVGNKWS